MFFPLRRLLAATSLALLSPLASAHTVWLEATDSATDYAVRFGGHAGVLEDFPPAKLTELRAIDGAGEPINIARQDLAAGVRLQTAEPASLLTLTFDNGIWSRLPSGRSENLPMNQVAGAESAVNAIKYHKYIARWDAQATQPQGQPFELVPLNQQAPAAGASNELAKNSLLKISCAFAKSSVHPCVMDSKLSAGRMKSPSL